MKTLNALNMRKLYALAALSVCFFTLNSCDKEISSVNNEPSVEQEKPAKDIDFYALCEDGKLRKYNTKNLQSPLSTVAISGLDNGQKLVAIDFRPATGELYGLGDDSRIYVINYTTGAARAIGTGAFTPALDGEIAGFDFNPTVDRIRVVTNTGQNLRLVPETGAVAFTDGSINGAANAAITAVAYTNSTAGAATTTLYDIDQTSGKLFKQDPPNDGTLVEVGPLNVTFTGEGGFDISAMDNTALAALYSGDKANLYEIDLTSGTAYKVGNFSNNRIISIAIPTNPVAYAVDLQNNLLIFNPENPEPISKPITGVEAGEKVLGIDFRPVNGQLYGLGSSSKIYLLNPSSGVATVVGSAPFATALSGDSFGFDFNPVVDRIRIVSNTGQNLRVVPETGAIGFVDGNLNPGTPSVSAAAYLNNFAGTTATTLFDIDFETDKLFKQDPPNSGTLVQIGPLGVDVETANGFDIGGTSNTAYAILTCKDDGTKIYSIDLATGKAKAKVNFPVEVRGFTLGLGF